MKKGDLVVMTDEARPQFLNHKRFGHVTATPRPGSKSVRVGKTYWAKSHWRVATVRDYASETILEIQTKIKEIEGQLTEAKRAETFLCNLVYKAMLEGV